MKVTLKDIAKETGLAPSTISKYMNHKPVSETNRQKIEEAVKKSGYTVNEAARSLRTRKTHTVGIISPTIGHQYWGHVISYIEQFLWEHGYSTLICTHNVNSVTEYQSVQFLLDKQVDGIIYIAYSQDDSCIKLIQEHKIPLVFLDNKPDIVDADFVTSQNQVGAYNAVTHLIEHGHREIAVLTTANSLYTAIERLSGYKAALIQNHIPVRDKHIIYSSNNAGLEETQLPELLASSSPPTAILASSYDLGIDIITYAHQNGLKIPDDFSLVIFDDDRIFQALNITVVRQDFSRIVEETVGLLLKKIAKTASSPAKHIQIETRLIERSSVKFHNITI